MLQWYQQQTRKDLFCISLYILLRCISSNTILSTDSLIAVKADLHSQSPFLWSWLWGWKSLFKLTKSAAYMLDSNITNVSTMYPCNNVYQHVKRIVSCVQTVGILFVTTILFTCKSLRISGQNGKVCANFLCKTVVITQSKNVISK